MTATTRMLQGLTLTGMLCVSASAMDAQACMGRQDLAVASSSVSTTVAAAGAERMLLGRYGIAGRRVFAGVQAGYASYELRDPTAIAVGIDAGFAIPLGASEATQLCPFLQSAYMGKPFGPPGVTSALGLSLGRALPVTSSFAIAPFVQGGVLHRPFRYPGFMMQASDVDRYRGARSRGLFGGQAGLGVGLRFSEVLTITPSAIVPIGFGKYPGYGEITYSLGASFGFRR